MLPWTQRRSFSYRNRNWQAATLPEALSAAAKLCKDGKQTSGGWTWLEALSSAAFFKLYPTLVRARATTWGCRQACGLVQAPLPSAQARERAGGTWEGDPRPACLLEPNIWPTVTCWLRNHRLSIWEPPGGVPVLTAICEGMTLSESPASSPVKWRGEDNKYKGFAEKP